MYNFSCLLVCNLMCAFKKHQGVPTVAKLSVKLITQYVEITLGSEIVFYGRFHRFCSCQRLSLARLQGSTCQKKSNKTWKLKRHLDTQNFSFLDPIQCNSSKVQKCKVCHSKLGCSEDFVILAKCYSFLLLQWFRLTVWYWKSDGLELNWWDSVDYA